jgi:cytochrome c biogenesis protein CcdA
MSFYTTAAQVIPVFMIVLAVEARAAKTVGDYFSIAPRWLVGFAVLMIYSLMFTGEVLSLGALQDNDVTPGTENWVMAALIIGALLAFLGLLNLALAKPPVTDRGRSVDTARERDPQAQRERDPQTGTAPWVWSGLALALIALGRRTRNRR